MKTNPPSVTRRPVRRERSERYILLTLISFAASVSFTRLFLQLTGYPKLGSGELHIAHLLWGGLLLFIATLIPLLFANRWVYTTSALLSGVGVGLFIDEVGKFITMNNNYFYPAAAPIIYAFFLMTVLLYTQVRRSRPRNDRSEMYAILSELEEVLDNDLSAEERKDIIDHLHTVDHRVDHPDMTQLVVALEKFINSKHLIIATPKPSAWDRWTKSIKAWFSHWITPPRLRAALVGGLTVMGAWSLYFPVSVIAQSHAPDKLQGTLRDLVNRGLLRGSISMTWFELRLGLEFAIGLVLIFAAILLVSSFQRQGAALGYIGLLLLLTTVDLLVFYFDQFSTIVIAVLQLIVLLGLIYYRRNGLKTLHR